MGNWANHTLTITGTVRGVDYQDARAGNYLDRVVISIEPGLYGASDAEDVHAEYRGIGIRIEDDILITPEGCRVLGPHIPKAIAEVEALLRDLEQRA